jgi:hypothetical protein
VGVWKGVLRHGVNCKQDGEALGKWNGGVFYHLGLQKEYYECSAVKYQIEHFYAISIIRNDISFALKVKKS